MKEVILKIHDRSIRLDEEFFTLLLIKPLLLLFLYFSLYSRTEGFAGFTGGQLSVLLTFGLLLLVLFHFFFLNKNWYLSQLAYTITIFFILSGVIPLISFFIFDSNPSLIFRFSVEIAITFFMFLIFYYLIREQIITPKFLIYAIAILGVIASLQLLSNLIGAIRVRRLFGLGGVNYLGTSLALGAFSWLMITYNASIQNKSFAKKLISYFGLLVVLVALILSGTRAASLAFIVGIFLYQFFGMKSKRFRYYLIGLTGLLSVAIFIIAANIDLSLLWSRYSFAQLNYMAEIRFDIYKRSIVDMSIMEFLVGRPDLYLFSSEDSGERFVNPHNLLLATIRYNGILPFMILVLISFIILYKYFALYVVHKSVERYRLMEASIIVFLMIVTFYTMLSGGRFTRSFTFYIVIGYAVGYYEIFRNLISDKQYKKIIL